MSYFGEHRGVGGSRSWYDQDEGRWHHKFSQSWLNTTDTCLERARREHTKEIDDWQTDAGSVGSSVHSAIEWNLQHHFAGEDLDVESTVVSFHEEFSEWMTHEDFRWVKYTEKSARAFGERCVRQFCSDVQHTLPRDGWCEKSFLVPFVDNEARTIELSGTIDLGSKLGDFKTAGGANKYEKWQYQRWAIQPTVYTYALTRIGDEGYEVDEIDVPQRVPFEYIVLGMKEVHRFTVTRGVPEWRWLAQKCERIARLIELGDDMPMWPLNDNHALCSAKWCPAWKQCKGATGITF